MTREEFTGIMKPLVFGLRADMDLTTREAYFAALQHVPAPLFRAAVSAHQRELRKFLPTASEMLARAEQCRVEFLSALPPWTGCERCQHTRGWIDTTDRGVPAVQRCPCRARYLEEVAATGYGQTLLAAPVSSDPAMALSSGDPW